MLPTETRTERQQGYGATIDEQHRMDRCQGPWDIAGRAAVDGDIVAQVAPTVTIWLNAWRFRRCGKRGQAHPFLNPRHDR